MARITLTREFYIPKHPGTTKVSHTKSGATVYIYALNSIPYAVGFRSDRTTKPDFSLRFKTETSREAYIKRFFAQRAEVITTRRVVQDRALNVGDIVYASWGYEQTNIDFYQVVGLKGNTSVVLRPIAQVNVEATGPMSEKVVAQKDAFVGDAITRRCRGTNVKIDSVRYASKWDGRALHQSHYH